MSKRIALVTGGMGGIGHAICRALHQQGMQVVAAYKRDHKAAQSWQEKERKAGFDFAIAYVDVTDFTSCEDLIKKVESEIGPIDVLINNAGITRDSVCGKMSKINWDIVISTNLNSVFYMSRAVINGMKDRGYGRIINIASINGQKGQFGQVNYSASKAGMHGFTKALAREVAVKGITVNTVSPGYVVTDMVMAVPETIREKILAEIPIGRFAQPDEVARVVVFLADEKSSYITGANFAINGGQYLL